MKNARVTASLLFTTVLSVSTVFSAASAATTETPGSKAQPTRQNSTNESGITSLPHNGGAPAQALQAYFTAIGKRDWNAVKALTPLEIRSMMEEDEADGYSAAMLDRMAKSSPRRIEIVEAWIEQKVLAHVRYRGRVSEVAVTGHAELVLENGEWLVTVTGVGE